MRIARARSPAARAPLARSGARPQRLGADQLREAAQLGERLVGAVELAGRDGRAGKQLEYLRLVLAGTRRRRPSTKTSA